MKIIYIPVNNHLKEKDVPYILAQPKYQNAIDDEFDKLSTMVASPHLLENKFLQSLAGNFPRSPLQINQLLEGDAELIRLSDSFLLAVTTDSIVEEISTGLYSDPGHIGWMTVVANLSDLAAVGAEPLGMLLSHCLPAGFSDQKLEALQNGIAEACRATHVFVLGGDFNQSPHWQMGGTAIGLIREGPVISRKGAKPGDSLYVSGAMGIGNAYAFQVLMRGKTAVSYWPLPRLREGSYVRRFGSSCIDSSDGFFPAVCNLMEINHLGVELTLPFASLVHPAAMELATENKLPAWVFLAGPHGEFELVFTISKEREDAFLKQANQINWQPVKAGTMTEDLKCSQKESLNEEHHLDIFQIANLFTESGGDPQVYLSKLIEKNESWKKH